jgi:katanin p60 ATPase-containing subunit A1
MALLRRLEKRILVPLPELEAREAMVRHHLPPGKRAVPDIDFGAVAESLEGYSGSDIKLVCKEAAMKPLRRIMKDLDVVSEKEDLSKPSNWHRVADPAKTPQLGPVTKEDITEAIQTTKASAKVVNNEKYFKWMENYGST